MGGDTDVATVAAAVADRGRSTMLLALGDGRALPASRLAWEAGVAASTASAHLATLVDAGLVVVEQRGRHRFYRLAGPHVARMLEAMALVAPAQPVRSLREGTRAEALRSARTCYDHLAGKVGVALLDALYGRGILERRNACCVVTDAGLAALAALEIDVHALASRRPLTRECLDWSEQRPHLAGALGAALTQRLFDMGWLQRLPSSRAVRVTDAGREGLRDRLGVALMA